MVANFIMPMLPETWRTNKAAYYGVKAASVLIPSWLVGRFMDSGSIHHWLLMVAPR
jgi:hypothetical protein